MYISYPIGQCVSRVDLKGCGIYSGVVDGLGSRGQEIKSFPFENIFRRNLVIFGVFFAGLFALALGAGLFFFKGLGQSDDIQIITSGSDTVSETEIIIHVDGAVAAPGVYRLGSDSRAGDAIAAAGGLTADANRAQINLAAKVADGQKIYVPVVGESVQSVSQVAGESAGQLVNVNTASESELDKLPGIGPVTAKKIIASRPYSSPEELKTKKAVSGATYEKIKELITF